MSDVAIRAAKPREKAYKLSDERGPYLLVSTTGARLWRFKYRFAGKEKMLAFGEYPDVALANRKTDKQPKGARDYRDEARALLRDGVDPGAFNKARKIAEKSKGREHA